MEMTSCFKNFQNANSFDYRRSESMHGDNNQNSEALTMGSGKGRSGGCYVNTAMGFVMLLLAILIAVGVGLIVHFAGAPVVVPCTPDAVSGGTGAQAGSDKTTKVPPTNPCENCPCTSGSPVTTTPSGQSVSTGAPSTSTAGPVLDVRLPTDLYPLHYNVELQPNMYDGEPKEFTFNGSVDIDLECKEVTNVVKVHINKLNVTSYSFARKDGVPAPTYGTYTLDKEREFFVLQLNGDLEKGQVYVLTIAFVGFLADDLAGLYRSSYFDKTLNKTIYIATSQMQPTDARKTFPCFDEPAIKSNFTVTLVRKEPMISISNMPIKETETRDNGWIADHYETTVKMSTYLLAFIVCDFLKVEQNTTTGTTVRVWARREAINQTQYALDAGVAILEHFEDYFAIPYPLPKADMIAIPDFAAGAMENWGLITYRETALLYDPKVSSASNKQRVAVVVSHELAHQWFGNLVTPVWWDDLWLNEGFASYVEYLGVDFFEPEWRMLEQFVTEDFQNVMQPDGLGSSHPIFIPVNHPDEINEIFDRISYGKGATIIRMMNFFLTESVFKSGVTDYLNKKAYDAATKDDLWEALKLADAGKRNTDVKAIMDTWTLQMGYPVVNVTVNGNKLDLTQEHFLLDPSQPPDDNKFPNDKYKYQWEIPFTYTTNTEDDFQSSAIDWMHYTDAAKQITSRGQPVDLAAGDWVIGNLDQYGFYRVNYDAQNWENLLTQLHTDHTKIGVINRAQIIDDSFNLARSGAVADPLLPMKTTQYLVNETEYLPWDAALVNLNYVSRMMKRSQYYGNYEKYMLQQILPLYNLMGWEDNITAPILEQYKRIYALDNACARGHQPCKDIALKLYSDWMNTTDPDNSNPISTNLKSLVYCNAISNGGSKEWDFAFERYQKANVASEKSKLLYAMSCSKTVWILSRYLDWTLDASKIRKQDATSTIIYISRNSIGRSLAWDFLQEKFDYIRNEYGGGSFSFSGLISGIPASFNTEFDLRQLEEFQSRHPDLGSGTRAFQQAIEKTKSNIKWMQANEKLIGEWLATAA